LTSNISEADLRQQINDAVSLQNAIDNAVLESMNCTMEQEAFDDMNNTPPDFLIIEDAVWKPIYDCE
jgi:hypothetical protein